LIEPIFTPIVVAQTGVVDLAKDILKPLNYVLSDQLAMDFLFGGKIEHAQKTQFAVQKFVERYAQSIDALNRAIMLGIAFVPIALLSYAGAEKIPIIDLPVSRQDWLRVCPAISYGLQFFTLIALCWFFLLRRGLNLLKKELGDVDQLGDIGNLMLTGLLGHLWLLASILRRIPSRWHLLWFIPVALLLGLIVFSPAILCWYFITELFRLNDLTPALIYSVLLPPGIALALVLVAMAALESTREFLDDEA